jgi:hypothetical protein
MPPLIGALRWTEFGRAVFDPIQWNLKFLTALLALPMNPMRRVVTFARAENPAAFLNLGRVDLKFLATAPTLPGGCFFCPVLTFPRAIFLLPTASFNPEFLAAVFAPPYMLAAAVWNAHAFLWTEFLFLKTVGPTLEFLATDGALPYGRAVTPPARTRVWAEAAFLMVNDLAADFTLSGDLAPGRQPLTFQWAEFSFLSFWRWAWKYLAALLTRPRDWHRYRNVRKGPRWHKYWCPLVSP